MIKLSLIVPTYNRHKFLQKSIPTFINQSLAKDIYEILIIDNNSIDDTKSISKKLLSNFYGNWRYIFEKKQGLHHARNRGILESKGNIIVFGDDDIIASKRWLEHILKEFDTNVKAGVVGGKIIPIFMKSPPDWIYDHGTKKTHGIFAYLDYGNKKSVLNYESLMGCNLAIRKDIAIKIGGSYPDTYPKNLKHLSGNGEGPMIQNAQKLGWQIVYLPEAYVHHHVDSKRLTLEYFIDRNERWAIEYSFHIFRNKNKLISSIILLTRSFKVLSNAYLEYIFESVKKFLNIKNKYKYNIKYYLTIKNSYSKEMLKQIIRIMTNKKLYQHITYKNYLDQINI